MAQYVYDIEGQPLNMNPLGNGWTNTYDAVRTSTFGVSVIETIANPVGTKAWRTVANDNAYFARLALWTAVPTDAETIEVLSLQSRDHAEHGMGHLHRFAAPNLIEGYFLGLRNNATEIRCRRWAAEFPHNMGAAAHGLASSVDAWVWQRSQSEGNTHRARTWLDGNPEPSTWMIQESNAQYASGAVGWGDYTRWTHTNTLAWFSLGTNGDPAPDSPLDFFRFRHHPRLFKVIPTLSSPTVTDIGATCVRPRVTKGF